MLLSSLAAKPIDSPKCMDRQSHTATDAEMAMKAVILLQSVYV